MFSIGDFARHGRVSVRMLRHYDAIGLLRPARVDDATGYRHYEAHQLARLNRIVALKDLGFTLRQIHDILDEQVGADELWGMLRLRQAELEERIAADTNRLAEVAARLHLIEREGQLPPDEIQVKVVPPVRVAELSDTAASYVPEDIGPVLRPLFAELLDRVRSAGLAHAGPALAYYEDAGDGAVRTHAAVPVNVDPADARGFAVVDLPEVRHAATILHRGPMDGVLATTQTLARWLAGRGYRPLGYAREVHLRYGHGDPATWVTEIQEPMIVDDPAGGHPGNGGPPAPVVSEGRPTDGVPPTAAA